MLTRVTIATDIAILLARSTSLCRRPRMSRLRLLRVIAIRRDAYAIDCTLYVAR